MSENSKKIDAVFEGGGVKGSAIVGAVVATEELGYSYSNVAGTSAGAIVASLIAAGYTGEEMRLIMADLDYQQFKDPTFFSAVPLVGPAISLLIDKGIYKGDAFSAWLRELLLKKNVKTFKDLIIAQYAEVPQYRYRLQVVASDVSLGKLLVLPGDSVDYGINPDDLDVVAAVRMSMSIPYFYRPIKLRGIKGIAYIVDGAILSNYPVWLFDDGSNTPPWPTIGYKLVDPEEKRPHKIFGPITLFAALFQTMMEAHDARYIKDSDFVRTVPILTLGVQTTDFDITADMKQQLYTSGYQAAKDFFSKWNFEEYKAKFRQSDIQKSEVQSRTDRVWSENKR